MLPESKITNKEINKYKIKFKNNDEVLVIAIDISANGVGDYVFLGQKYETVFLLDEDAFIYVEKVGSNINVNSSSKAEWENKSYS